MWTDKPFGLRAVRAVFLAISSPVDSADVVTVGPFWFLDESRARPTAGVTRRGSGSITRQADSLLSIQSGPVRPVCEGAHGWRWRPRHRRMGPASRFHGLGRARR